ncbi:MAG: glycosyltransferase family 52, partial [Colwellia sp.]
GEVLKRWPVTDVLLHPRSSKVSHFEAEGATVVRTVLIAEDYILSLISQGYGVTVIGIYSSTLLNVLSIPNLNLINLEPPLNKPTEKLHELLIEAGVMCIEVGGEKNAS